MLKFAPFAIALPAAFALSIGNNVGPDDNIVCSVDGVQNRPVIRLATNGAIATANVDVKDGICKGVDSGGTSYTAPLSHMFCGLDQRRRPVVVNGQGQLLHLAQDPPKQGNLYELFGLSAGRYGAIRFGEKSCTLVSFGETFTMPRADGMASRIR